MPKKKPATIHESLTDFAATIEKNAYRRGQLSEQLRIGKWIASRLDGRCTAAERNALTILAAHILDETK